MLIRTVSMLLPLALLAPTASAAPAVSAATSAVRISIEDSTHGEPVRNTVHQAPIRGSASAERVRSNGVDVIIAIDVSHSTREPSGVDVNGNGIVGFDPTGERVPTGTYPPGTSNTDAGDSILAAEVAAADALIRNLDPDTLRVGVLSFAGEVNPLTFQQASYGQQDAWLEASLTSDFLQARRALQNILARGPRGGTNFAAGVRLAVTELAGLFGGNSTPRPDAKKVVMFLTDGIPSFPFGSSLKSDPGDTEAALNAARLAHKAGITINTYALGLGALSNPIAAIEMSRITLGTFTPVQNPGDVITYLRGASFSNVEDVVFANLTTSEISEDVQLSPDGSFSGYVPVREGVNRVRVTALATDGSEGSVEFDLDFAVSGLNSRELSIELERIRRQNRELQIRVESDRIQRFRAKQRKELKIEAEEP